MTAKKTNLSRLRLRRPRILWRSLAETLATAVDPLGELPRFYTARPPLPNFLLNSARLSTAVRFLASNFARLAPAVCLGGGLVHKAVDRASPGPDWWSVRRDARQADRSRPPSS